MSKQNEIFMSFCTSNRFKTPALFTVQSQIILQSLLICMIEAFERLSLTSSQYYTELSASQYSQHLIDCPPIRKLDCLIVTNFKSFKGKVYVGPLLDFTSIIGPNGAGKSNILDALMFCLCNERSKINFYDLREFIQRDGEETYNEMMQRKKFCEVQAHFIVATGKTLVFKRTLYPNEKQEFSIDGEQYTQRVYENFLMRCNLNFMTSNYAIWQGEIDKILLKNPKELTSMLQTISGSAYFKNDQMKFKQELQEIEQVVQAQTAKLVKLRIERKNIKKLHNTKDNNVKTQAEYEKIMKKMLMAKMHLSQLEIKEAEREFEAADKEERRRVKELNESKVRMQKEQTERIEIQNRMNTLIKEVAQNSTLLKTIEQSANIIDIQAFKDLENEVHSLKRYADNLKSRKAQLQREGLSLQSLDIDKQYLALYRKWEKENEVMTKELAKKKNQYVYSEELLRTKRGILNQFHEKGQRAEKQEQEQARRKKELETHAEELGKSIAWMKVENGKISQEYLNNKGRLQDRYQKLETINERIIELEGMMVENIENEKDKQLVKKLGGVEGFKGLMEESIKPASKKYELCFQIMMGTLLKHILSADQNASKQIAGKLREYGQIRTLIILSNARERKDPISRTVLGKKAHLALDSVDFQKSIVNLGVFLQDYLHGKVICDNMEEAWALQAQEIRGIKEIYTLDGNVLRQDGIVTTYGSVDLIKNKYKYVNGAKSRTLAMEEIQGLQKEKVTIENDIKALKEKVSDEKIARHNLQVAKLQARREEITGSLNLIKKGGQAKKEIKIPKGLEGEIQELEKRVGGIRESMKEIEKEMLGSKIFTDFIKRNKIKDLGQFRSLEDLSSLEGKMKQKNKAAREIEETDREVVKVLSNLAIKEERLQRLSAKVNASVSQDEKAEVVRNIKKGEEELANLRGRLTKMNNISIETLKFKSQLPQIESKLSLLKERYENMVKAEVAQLGLESAPESSQFKELQDHLRGTTLNRATKENFNIAYEELQKESRALEAELQKQILDISSFDDEGNSGERISKEIETIDGILKACNEKKAKVSENLEAVKRDRKNLFMNFFTTLRPILLRTYQLLTENTDGVPGKADLFLQNEDFPCDDGVYYFPTPPTKRFVYDLDQLSGGEKSLASLALQYSIAITSKSPFLMLDEIDAFLDAANVSKFVRLVNESIRDKSLQFILVTHKRSLFLGSKSMVGVTKTRSNPFSQAYSLRLTAEDQEEEEP